MIHVSHSVPHIREEHAAVTMYSIIIRYRDPRYSQVPVAVYDIRAFQVFSGFMTTGCILRIAQTRWKRRKDTGRY